MTTTSEQTQHQLEATIKEHWATIRARLDARSKPAREASDALQAAFEAAGLVEPVEPYTKPRGK